jgi:hypothetical protein
MSDKSFLIPWVNWLWERLGTPTKAYLIPFPHKLVKDLESLTTTNKGMTYLYFLKFMSRSL